MNEGDSERAELQPGDLTADELVRLHRDLDPGPNDASGGSLEVTKVTNASLTFTTNAQGVALVGTSAPSTGYARVYLDNAYISSFNTNAHSTQTEKVEESVSMNYGKHEITYKNIGTSGHPYFDVDAFIVTK